MSEWIALQDIPARFGINYRTVTRLIYEGWLAAVPFPNDRRYKITTTNDVSEAIIQRNNWLRNRQESGSQLPVEGDVRPHDGRRCGHRWDFQRRAEQAKEIRRRYAKDDADIVEMAAEYGLSRSRIYHILNQTIDGGRRLYTADDDYQHDIDERLRRSKLKRGEGNRERCRARRKLTADQVRAIRNAYDSGISTTTGLAREYQANPGTIWRIVNRRIYREIC